MKKLPLGFLSNLFPLTLNPYPLIPDFPNARKNILLIYPIYCTHLFIFIFLILTYSTLSTGNILIKPLCILSSFPIPGDQLNTLLQMLHYHVLYNCNLPFQLDSLADEGLQSENPFKTVHANV